MKQQIKEWFPDAWDQLSSFYANKAGVSIDIWKRSMEVIISDNFYGIGDDVIDVSDARSIIKKVMDILPPMRKSSWTDDNGDEYIEFIASPRQLNIAYFEEIRKILGLTAILSE